MSWFPVDDHFCEHPKVLDLLGNLEVPQLEALAALGLWVLCGSWCRLTGSSGHVPFVVINRYPKGLRLADHLTKARGNGEAGLWVPDGRGFRFHDWEQFSQDLESRRQAARDRKRLQRERARVCESRGPPGDSPRDVTSMSRDCHAGQTVGQEAGQTCDDVTLSGSTTKTTTTELRESLCNSVSSGGSAAIPWASAESRDLAALDQLVRATSPDPPRCRGKLWPLPVCPGWKTAECLAAVLAASTPDEVVDGLRVIARAIESGEVDDWPQGKRSSTVWASLDYVLGFWPDVLDRAKRWADATTTHHVAPWEPETSRAVETDPEAARLADAALARLRR